METEFVKNFVNFINNNNNKKFLHSSCEVFALITSFLPNVFQLNVSKRSQLLVQIMSRFKQFYALDEKPHFHQELFYQKELILILPLKISRSYKLTTFQLMNYVQKLIKY